MSSEVVDRAIGIEGRVERKSSTYTSAFHLPLGVHMGVDVVPGKNGLCAIVLCIEPSLVDGVGEAVAINGCAGSLQIGVRTVEQLMPSPIVMLERQQASQVLLEVVHDEG